MPSDSYISGWRDYSRRRRLTLLGGLGFLPVMLSAGLLSEGIGGDRLFLGVGICWFAVMSAAGVYFVLFRCPRCGHFFHLAPIPSSWRVLLGLACAYCALRLYESGNG